jgi:hypothetical protein
MNRSPSAEAEKRGIECLSPERWIATGQKVRTKQWACEHAGEARHKPGNPVFPVYAGLTVSEEISSETVVKLSG